VLGAGAGTDWAVITEPADRSLLAQLAELITGATESFEAYDYTGALESTEQFFWQFCDDYLELVKERAYGPADDSRAASARATLTLSLDIMLRLFAPIMPYVTEEVWSWWRDGSIHRTRWPLNEEIPVSADAALLTDVSAALIQIRGAKSQASVSMKTEISLAKFYGTVDALAHLQAVESDLRAVGRITGEISWVETDGPIAVDVTLA
jgi:valyl-tRNA synthetase